MHRNNIITSLLIILLLGGLLIVSVMSIQLQIRREKNDASLRQSLLEKQAKTHQEIVLTARKIEETLRTIYRTDQKIEDTKKAVETIKEEIAGGSGPPKPDTGPD